MKILNWINCMKNIKVEKKITIPQKEECVLEKPKEECVLEKPKEGSDVIKLRTYVLLDEFEEDFGSDNPYVIAIKEESYKYTKILKESSGFSTIKLIVLVNVIVDFVAKKNPIWYETKPSDGIIYNNIEGIIDGSSNLLIASAIIPKEDLKEYFE